MKIYPILKGRLKKHENLTNFGRKLKKFENLANSERDIQKV